MAQTLKFGNKTWATKVGSTLAYNDENDNYKPLPFAFTRSTSATRVNKEGLIEVVTNDRPRIDYTDTSDGVLLLEKAATNLVTYSEDFSNAAWVKLGAGTGSTAIVTSDYAISPDGTQNASRLQCDLNGGLTSSGNQSLIYDAISGSGDTSGFIYVKSNTNSSQTFYLANSLNDYVNGVATTDWQRIEINWNAAGNGRTFAIGTRGTSNSDDSLDLLIWGAQVESGNVASSYIPTQGSATTRVAETASGSGNSEVFNDSEGVLFADVSALDSESTNKMITISNGSNGTRVLIRFVGSTLLAQLRISGVNQYEFGFDPTNIKDNFKIALKYKENNFSFFVNGFKLNSSNNGSTFSNNTLSELSFDDGSGGNDFYGKTKEIGYYDAILTDLELETLTSYKSWTSMVNELNLNIIYNG